MNCLVPALHGSGRRYVSRMTLSRTRAILGRRVDAADQSWQVVDGGMAGAALGAGADMGLCHCRAHPQCLSALQSISHL